MSRPNQVGKQVAMFVCSDCQEVADWLTPEGHQVKVDICLLQASFDSDLSSAVLMSGDGKHLKMLPATKAELEADLKDLID
jgi:hypothetical protein